MAGGGAETGGTPFVGSARDAQASKAPTHCTSSSRVSRLTDPGYNRRCGIAGTVPVVST